MKMYEFPKFFRKKTKKKPILTKEFWKYKILGFLRKNPRIFEFYHKNLGSLPVFQAKIYLFIRYILA